ncbi:Leucyl aminopeptidase (aminopeptidase T) [Lentibacillus persicus]|uniref:Leucyl aminopeptidase (Aminopeptidase T) n=2 Tax=Lentibacillus persicus TaxID=640948 RepID=A0A1I1VZ10_9BACI|nr:aminopeptidase [Lentibacillus persicus]SFD88172.1 Leucyl aminopeptidase (aminopeptidase T) [Lentibacillus persicus]
MSLVDTAKNVILQNLRFETGETVLIITDDDKKEIADLFYQASKELSDEAVIIKMPTRNKSGEEPPQMISGLMKMADVVLCVTKHSLTHTKARKEASEVGARVATMPGVTMNMLENGAISADYNEVQELTEKYCQILNSGENVKIAKDDYELTFSIKERKSISSTGVFKKPGESGNVPSGESYIAPIEDSANGNIVIDGAVSNIGVLDEPIKLKIESGRLIDATGKNGKKLLELLGDGDGRTIAEFGIGTNKKARLIGNVLEDEKVFGTVHIAFGSNKSFGGVTEAGVHIDCIIKSPDVWIDSQKI